MGIALAHGLVGFVAQTVNDFYFTVEVTGLAIPTTWRWSRQGLWGW